jgi:membrane associated rhomboid family serine protease
VDRFHDTPAAAPREPSAPPRALQPMSWVAIARALASGDVPGVGAEKRARVLAARAALDRARRGSPDRRLDLTFSRDFEPWTLVTHMFMHAGWGHLLGNLWFFLLVAPPLEDRWGVRMFLVLYLVGGLVAALSMFPLLAGTDQPLLGASGAVAACMGAFCVRHWNAKARFFWVRGLGMSSAKWGEIWMPAWLMIGLWAAEQAMYASVQRYVPVAVWAHLGGFAFGAGLALALRATRWEDRFFETEMLRGGKPSIDDVDTRMALDLTEKRAWRDASAYTIKALERHPDHPVLLAVHARSLAHLGDPAEASRALSRAIAEARATGPSEHLLDAAQALGERVATLGLDPVLEQLLGRWFEESGEPDDALWVYRDLAESHPAHALAPRALYRIADLHRTRRGDRVAASAAYRVLLERYPEHPLAAQARAALDTIRAGGSPSAVAASR